MSFDEFSRSFIKQMFGDTNEKRVKALEGHVTRANALESEMEKLTDDELRSKTAEFKQIIENALKTEPNTKLIADDVPKMPGQIRFSHDRLLASVLEKLMPEA